MNIAEGVIAALLSPMHEDESIHCEQMRRLAARQIAAGQGGYCKVTSRPGEGSTFSLYLPREL